MDDWQRNVIRVNLPELLHHTIVNDLFLAILTSCGVVCPADIEHIKGKKGDISKASDLYKILLTRSGGYDALLIALGTTCQTGAMEILRTSREMQESRRVYRDNYISVEVGQNVHENSRYHSQFSNRPGSIMDSIHLLIIYLFITFVLLHALLH